jgi:hypothetical protein
VVFSGVKGTPVTQTRLSVPSAKGPWYPPTEYTVYAFADGSRFTFDGDRTLRTAVVRGEDARRRLSQLLTAGLPTDPTPHSSAQSQTKSKSQP